GRERRTARKIAIAHGLSEHSARCDYTCVSASQFDIREEKSFGPVMVIVIRNKYRTPEAAAENVLFERRSRRREKIPGIQYIVAQVVVSISVKLLRTRFGADH